jgi:hypothetical protein
MEKGLVQEKLVRLGLLVFLFAYRAGNDALF